MFALVLFLIYFSYTDIKIIKQYIQDIELDRILHLGYVNFI